MLGTGNQCCAHLGEIQFILSVLDHMYYCVP